MTRSANIRHVVKAVAANLRNHMPEIADAIAEFDQNLSFNTVLPYFTTNLDVNLYPLVMVAQEEENRQWIGLPNIALDTFNATIWGLVQYDKADVIDDIIGVFAGLVRDALNSRHAPIQVDSYEIFFNEVCPVSNIKYGIPTWAGNPAIVRGFTASFTSSVEVTVKDETQ